MQIPTPAHHAFVRKFRLKSVLSEAATPRGIITFDAENTHILNRKGSQRLSNKSDSHLSFEENCLAGSNDGRDSFQPLEGHGSLPGTSRQIASSKCGHDRRGRNPDRVKAKNGDRRTIHFDCRGDCRFPCTRCTCQDHQSHDTPLPSTLTHYLQDPTLIRPMPANGEWAGQGAGAEVGRRRGPG